MKQEDGRYWWQSRCSLLLVLALALSLRAGAVVVLGVPDIVWSSEYGSIASRLVQGQAYTFDLYGLRSSQPLRSFMPPLYTFLLAGVLRFFPSPAFALGLIQALLATATCFLGYQIGKVLCDIRVGLVAAGVLAVYPVYVIQTARPLPLTLNAFLLSALICLVLSMRDGGHLAWRAVGVGLLLGFSGLSRPVLLGLGGGIALWLWVNRERVYDAPAKTSFQWWRALLISAVVTMLVLAPWMIRNWMVHHRFVPISTNGGLTFWNGNNPFTTGSGFDVYVDRLEAYVGHSAANAAGKGPIVMLKPYPLPRSLDKIVPTMDEVDLDRELYKAGLEFIQTQPRSWLSLFLTKVWSLWWFRPNVGDNAVFYEAAWIWPYRILYAGVLLLFCVGLVVSIPQWRNHVMFYYVFPYLTVAYAAFNVLTKYRWEVEQFMLLFGVAGVITLTDRLRVEIEARRNQSLVQRV